MNRPDCKIDGCTYATVAKGMCDAHYRRSRSGLPVDVPIVRTTQGMTLAGRMIHYTDRRGADDCWPWRAGHDKDGYGEVSTGGANKHRRAHVVAWELANEDTVPKGMVVMHSCDNPDCVNPRHLSLGTNLDNIRDRDQKGRMARGSACGRSKLSEDDVLRIRRAYRRGVAVSELSFEYRVSVVSIYNVVNRRTWTHI